MEKRSSSESNISLDSLEEEFKRKTCVNNGIADDNVETILVPFYEKDVLMKVPKEQKRKEEINNKQRKSNNKLKKEQQHSSSYLVNRDKQKTRHSYLEMFRKQFIPNVEKKTIVNEIRSISPEFGDTERESIGEEANNPVTEFYNTESYNEIYYEKLLRRDLDNYLDNSFEDELHYNENRRSKSPDDMAINNLRSISEVSNPRRHVRRATVQPVQNVNLGGLGPDMEKIKPRLERARSLQRYSEKVRMENRLKIYKRSVQADIDKKIERETSAKQRNSIKMETKGHRDDQRATYLVNKSTEEKSSNIKRKICYSKSKSADIQKTKATPSARDQDRDKSHTRKTEFENHRHQTRANKTFEKEDKADNEGDIRVRTNYSARTRGINTAEALGSEVPPVQISFMVNVGGVRPSTALRTLEEKHRMYREQVKAFKIDNNNNG